jgi:putative membrane protein
VVEAWSWTPKPYIGVWILCIGLGVGYFWARRRHAAHLAAGGPADAVALDPKAAARERRRPWQFLGGLAFLWVASDWPIGTLGASYLASVHMLQYMIYTLGAAPLLMLGTPEWMWRRMIDALRLGGVQRVIAKPLVAAIVSNVILIVTHSPISVDTLRASQFGSFALDMIWLVGGFILWTPIVSPMPSVRARSAPVKLVYLFAAAALMPMIPGGFLTFSPQPLYGTFELAPRVGVEALDDQQMAGVLMKVGNLPVIWTVMAVIWFRWYKQESGDEGRTIVRDPVTGAPLRRPAASRTAPTGVATRTTSPPAASAAGPTPARPT